MTPEERLLNALSNISDDLITEAAHSTAKPRPWRRFAAIAACAALVIGLFSQLGGGAGGGSDGSADGLTYDRYIGPVMPLTTLEDSTGLTAARTVTYDFNPYTQAIQALKEVTGQDSALTHYPAHTEVTDNYTLQNTTDQDMTVTAVYPFPAGFSDYEDIVPFITVDYVPQNPQLIPGPYLNIYTPENKHISSGEDLQAVLETDDYFNTAFSALPVLNQPVTVYRIGNVRYDGPIGDNPTLAFKFKADLDTTKVLTYRVPGVGYDDDTGEYRITADRLSSGSAHDSFVILLGRDVEGYVLQGYSNGACEEGTEIDGFTANVIRYETTLGQFLLEEFDWDEYRNMYNHGMQRSICTQLTDEQMLGYTAQIMEYYGGLEESGFDRLIFMEDWVSSAIHAARMMYLTFEITIPAGGSVEVQAKMLKDGSVDHFGNSTKDRNGYDMMTRLGSDLTFTEQTASIVNFDDIEIMDQNFGFDPDNGVTTVVLDLTRQHYWMNVRKHE